MGSMCTDESVVTANCYAPLVKLVNNKCPVAVAIKYRRILGQLLVPARRLLLARVCNFLRDFSKHEATTQMGCTHLAICFANLMQPPLSSECDGNRSKRGKKKKFRRSAEQIR